MSFARHGSPHSTGRLAGAVPPPKNALDGYLSFWRYSRRAIALVWSTHRGLTIGLGVLTLAAGLMPAGVAYLGKLIVDAVVAALAANQAGAAPDYAQVLWFVGLEGLLVAALAGVQRGIAFCQSLLRVLLSQRVHFLILDKALTLSLGQFEDSEFYDKLNRARQEASVRPLSLVNRTFALAQNGVSLASYAGLLLAFSPWAVAILVAAGLAGVRGRDEVLRRAVSRVSVAQPGPAHAGLPRNRARARGPRQRGQAVRSRRAAARALSRDLSAHLRRGEAPHDPPRRLGIRARARQQRGLLRRVRVDRARDDRRRHLARRDDDVSLAVQAGAIGRRRDARRDRRHVRGQSLSIEPLRLSRAAVGRRARGRDERHRCARRHRVRRRHASATRAPPCRRCAT